MRLPLCSRNALVFLLLLGLVGACSSGAEHRSAAATASSNGSAHLSPVIDQNFPDPDVLFAGGAYYAYATQPSTAGRNLQVATSRDLKSWRILPQDPLPHLPAWAAAGRTWAPDVSAVGSSYVMYFTARNVSPDLQCIGVARGTSPAGPFIALGTRPLVCPTDQGGAIDPASFVDANGQRYLLWKNDGNCCGKDTWLYVQPVSPDGLRLTGPATRLIKEDQSWEGHVVEAPTLVRHGDTYLLFYSANDYSGSKYSTGYATARRVQGPYHKAARPLLSTASTKVIGPGGQDVITDRAGRTWIVFHAWNGAVVYRAMYVVRLDWRGATPEIHLRFS